VPPFSVIVRWPLHHVDHRMGRLLVELGRVGALEARHVAGELDRRDLHPEAEAVVGHLALAGVLRRLDLAPRCRGGRSRPGTRMPLTPSMNFAIPTRSTSSAGIFLIFTLQRLAMPAWVSDS
jgi:hypothetical protein